MSFQDTGERNLRGEMEVVKSTERNVPSIYWSSSPESYEHVFLSPINK